MTETNETPETFCETLQDLYKDFTVIKDALRNPHNWAKSENFGLFLPDQNWKELPRTFKAGYVPHTLEQVCAVVEAASQVLDLNDAKMVATWDNGHRITFTFGEAVEIAPNDLVYPTLNIYCGYNGNAFKATFGLFRLVCSNGMVIPVDDTKAVSCRLIHSAKMEEYMPKMIQDLTETAENIEELYTMARRMSVKMVNFDTTYEAIFGEEPPKGHIWATRKQAIRSIITREQLELNHTLETELVSAWLMFNGVQGYYQNTMGPKRGRTRQQAIDWANNNVNVIKALNILTV